MAEEIHFYVSGRVQGVFFRAWTRDTALSLGLSGWVRNLRDGRVEGVAQGEEKAVNELIARLHEGPPVSVVDSVEVVRRGAGEPLEGFEVRY